MKSFDLLSNFFQFYVKKSKEKYHKNMSDYVEVENLPKANELINDDYVLINQNEDDAKVDMGTIKDFVRPPNASPTESGLVSTTEQTFSGKKSFTEIASNKATVSSLNSHNANLTEATVQDLHITGNLIQDGETIETEVETLKVKDQVIVTRSGATTGMTDGEVTGIVAEKYDGQNNGVLVFGSDGIARVGDEGDAQPLATREETPNNGSLQVWDEQTQSLKSFPFGQKGQYLRQGENGLEYGSAVAVEETASEEYVDNKVQEEATLRQNAIEEVNTTIGKLDYINAIETTTINTTDTIPMVQNGETKKVKVQTLKRELNSYSTNEQVIGTWIDGRPLYRKYLIYTFDANGKEESHGITYDKIISVSGTTSVLMTGGDVYYYPLGKIDSASAEYQIYTTITKTRIRFSVGAKNSSINYTQHIFVEYVKDEEPALVLNLT